MGPLNCSEEDVQRMCRQNQKVFTELTIGKDRGHGVIVLFEFRSDCDLAAEI